MATLKALIDETTNIKNELVACHTNLKNNLVAKGVEVSGNDKMSNLIDKVDYLKNVPNFITKNINCWSILDYLDVDLYNYSSTMHDKYIYIFGGYTTTYRNYVRRLDTETGKWENLPNMPTSRRHSKSCTVVNNLYVTGGQSSASGTGSASNLNEEYDVVANTWTSKTVLPYLTSEHVMTSYDEGFFVGGGYRVSYPDVGTTFIYYDCISNTYANKISIPSAVRGGFMTSYNNNIYIIANGNVYEYDVVANAWTSKSTGGAITGYVGVTVDNNIYILASPSNFNNFINKYDIVSDSWSVYGDIPKTLTRLYNGIGYNKGMIYLLPGKSISTSGYDYEATVLCHYIQNEKRG